MSDNHGSGKTKSCCGDTDIIQDKDGQVRCATCENLIYDYLQGDEISA